MSNLEKHLIGSQECELLAKAYEKTNYAEINKTRQAGKPDSLMYTIELEVLQDYLKLISSEMEKNGIKNKGVKVSLGKYPEKSTDPKMNPKHLGYQMIFFSPTDLDEKSNTKMNVEVPHENVNNMADIPNLNYMNLTPPH